MLNSRLLRRITVLSALFAAVAVVPASADGIVERVSERVFLVRDKPGTATQFQMIVNAGCAEEAGGQCRGIAHYVEHLVLVGRNSEHGTIAMRFFADGSSNGWTNRIATVYTHAVPPRANGPKADLEKLFGFYAARLKDFSISEDDAERERKVVLQEYEWRVGSHLAAQFVIKLDRALLPDHPAGQWAGGTKEDIGSFTLKDARAFHRNWYAPNNVFFVVKGDIDPEVLKGIAASALEGIVARPLPQRARLQAPEIVVERKDLREEDKSVKQAGVVLKKLVHVDEADPLAIDAADTLVTNFLTSRLPGSPHDVLVEKGKLAADSVSVALERVAPKTFVVALSANVAPDVAPTVLLSAMADYVDGLSQSGIPEKSIERLKKRYATSYANAERDPTTFYNFLTGWLANDYRFEDLADWPRRVAAVSASDIETILRGISGPGRIVTGILAPLRQEASR